MVFLKNCCCPWQTGTAAFHRPRNLSSSMQLESMKAKEQLGSERNPSGSCFLIDIPQEDLLNNPETDSCRNFSCVKCDYMKALNVHQESLEPSSEDLNTLNITQMPLPAELDQEGENTVTVSDLKEGDNVFHEPRYVEMVKSLNGKMKDINDKFLENIKGIKLKEETTDFLEVPAVGGDQKKVGQRPQDIMYSLKHRLEVIDGKTLENIKAMKLKKTTTYLPEIPTVGGDQSEVGQLPQDTAYSLKHRLEVIDGKTLENIEVMKPKKATTYLPEVATVGGDQIKVDQDSQEIVHSLKHQLEEIDTKALGNIKKSQIHVEDFEAPEGLIQKPEDNELKSEHLDVIVNVHNDTQNLILEPEEHLETKVDEVTNANAKESEKIKLLENNDNSVKNGELEENKIEFHEIMIEDEDVKEIQPDKEVDEVNEPELPAYDEHDESFEVMSKQRRLSKKTLSPTESEKMIFEYNSGTSMGKYGAVDVTGDILFSLKYDYEIGALNIDVRKCRYLAPVDTKRNRSNPHVKVYLLPDKSRSGKRKSKNKRHTLNPIFEETFQYSATIGELESRTLWITVWHVDKVGQNVFLGEVLLPLDSDSLLNRSKPEWYPLSERLDPFEYMSPGEITVSLKYTKHEENEDANCDMISEVVEETDSIHILVKEARNLGSMHAKPSSDPFCKCYLLPNKTKSGKQKSGVVKNNLNPVWNHNFTFKNIREEMLRVRSIELTVWDHDSIGSNIFLGGARLGPEAKESAGISWMDSHGQEAEIWKKMIRNPNEWVQSTVPLRPSMYVLVNRK